MARSVLLALHIILIIAWLGIDVGVFTSSFLIRKRGLSGDARVELRRLMRGLDLAPRLSLMATPLVGTSLASTVGFIDIPSWVIPLLTVVTVAWLAGAVWSYRRLDEVGRPRRDDAAPARIFGRVDLSLRAAIIAFFGVTGVVGIATGGGFWGAPFLAIKSLLFSITVVAGLWIRRAAKPFTPALWAVLDEGESEKQLQTMDSAMRAVYPGVLTIWIALIIMVFVATVRPG
jgi:hypothetical protein